MQLNRTTVIGRLGRDCTMNTLPNGSIALNFSVCHRKKYKDRDGEQRQQLTWFECTIWRGPQQNIDIQKRLLKGCLVYVEGEVSCFVRPPESDLPENLKAVLALRVQDVSFLNSKNDSECEDITN